MNIKNFILLFVAAALLSVSACGMKRALTLPKKKGEKEKNEEFLDI